MRWAADRRWTDERIARELQEVVSALGRMPSANELRGLGRNALACAIPRAGGYASWAERLATTRRGTETHRGQAIELRVMEELRALGFEVVRQSTKAPFDLLIAGRVRVAVKSATYTDYVRPNKAPARGFVFGLNKADPTCDLYVLCGVDGSNETVSRYFVPASEARVRTITITPKGKYTRFRDAVDQLKVLVTGPYGPKGDRVPDAR